MADDEEDLPNTSNIWARRHQVKGPGSTEPTYAALLSLPASNADSERCFSMVKKIDSEDCSYLERSTVASLLTLKPSDDQIKLAVQQYNEGSMYIWRTLVVVRSLTTSKENL